MECITIDLCRLGVEAWGKMAECWLDARTPAPGNQEGVHEGKEYPRDQDDQVPSMLDAIFASYDGEQAGAAAPRDWSQTRDTPTSFTATLLFVIEQFGAGLDSDVFLPPAPSVPHLYDEGGVFDRAGSGALDQLRIRSVALRPEERDPCGN